MLCPTSTCWTQVPDFCSWATKKILVLFFNNMLDTLDLTGIEHWALFSFS